MTYAVIGTGAIGGYYGGRLAQSGREVHFLAHSDYDEMLENGLRVDSCQGDFVIEHPHAHQSTATMPRVDVVLVALKTINNHLLNGMLPPIIGDNTIVVLIQNGIGVEEDVRRMFPALQIAAGMGFICSTKVGPAHISHQDYGALTLANYSCHDDAKVDAIAQDFIAVGVKTDILEYSFARWRKAIWNLPFNGLTVVLDTDTLSIVNCPETCSLVKQTMMEVISLAHAVGVSELTEEHADHNIAATRAMRPYAPSMKVDWDNHRPMEIHYLYTTSVQLASRLGVPCPALNMLHQLLLFKANKTGEQ